MARISPAAPAPLDLRSRRVAEAARDAAEAALGLARAELSRAEAQVDYAATQVERAGALLDRGTIPARALEQTRLDAAAANAALESARANLLVRERELESARAALIDDAPASSEGTCCVEVVASAKTSTSGALMVYLQTD